MKLLLEPRHRHLSPAAPRGSGAAQAPRPAGPRARPGLSLCHTAPSKRDPGAPPHWPAPGPMQITEPGVACPLATCGGYVNERSKPPTLRCRMETAAQGRRAGALRPARGARRVSVRGWHRCCSKGTLRVLRMLAEAPKGLSVSALIASS